MASMKFDDILELLITATRVEEFDSMRDELTYYIPYLASMFNYDQQNHAHQYDLWHHCLHTVLNLPRNMDDPMLYLAALLHDIGKPDCQCRGKREDDPNMHYYGHPLRSMEIVQNDIIPTLTEKDVFFTADEQRRLLYYVEYHDDRVSLRTKHLRRHLQIASLEDFKNLMHLQIADAKSHILLPVIEDRIRICSTWANGYADSIYLTLYS